MKSRKAPKHILVIRLSAMGDVAMTVPVLRAFVQQYPDVKLTVLTRGFFAPFFRGVENVQVFPVDVKGRHKGVFGLFRLSRELKQLGIDAVADLHNVLRSKILKFFLLGTPTAQLDKGRSDKKALVSGEVFQQLKTTHERYADVFRNMGFPLELSKPNFPERTPLNPKVLELLGTDTKKWIGIAPFAAHKGKMYPLNLMEEVIQSLSKDYKIVLFGGGASEIEQLQRIQDAHKNVLSIAGKLTLEEELDVVSNLDAMVSMDSGNGHMAAMLGVKTITIWGVTHPYAGFAPFNQPENYLLLADRTKFPLIPTSIYGNKYPEGYEEAASSISPQEVIYKIKAVTQ